jgi:hypothetical protein
MSRVNLKVKPYKDRDSTLVFICALEGTYWLTPRNLNQDLLGELEAGLKTCKS